MAEKAMTMTERVPWLPYGPSLHYHGCGCPADWHLSTRAADLVDQTVQDKVSLLRSGMIKPLRHLKVCYMLPHHNTTGGMKMLVEHLRLLKSRGHFTVAAHRSSTAERAMPPWASDVQVDVDAVCRMNQKLSDVLDVQDLDLVVVGIFHQVAELLASVSAPILYWEQGHEWLFGDPVRFQDQLFHMVMQLPVALAAVSPPVATILQREFGRQAALVPNAVDCARFFPGPRSDLPPSLLLHAPPFSLNYSQRSCELGTGSVLLVGNPRLPLKGFDIAIKTLMKVNEVLPLQVTWICQTAPTAKNCPALASSGLTILCYVNPPQTGQFGVQEQLAELYRGHDAFLFSSRYEAWGLPVLEAMASGLPVVATRCLGTATFCHHHLNCLLADPLDVELLASHLLRVLTDDSVRQFLQTNALATAQHFTPQRIATMLEAVLYGIQSAGQELLHLRAPSVAAIQRACAWACESSSTRPDCSKAA